MIHYRSTRETESISSGRFISSTICLAISMFFTGASAICADPIGWNHWRGPEANGISRETGLPDNWSPAGNNVLWSKEEFGTRSTPIVNDGKLYIVSRYKPETTEEGEQIVCLDAETGDEIWRHHHNVFLSDAPAERVGWSSPIADPQTGNVYWLGLGCQFMCLDGQTGEVLWQRSMSEEYGMLSTYGGRTNFPIVFEDLVIISGVMTQWGEHAVPAHRFVAFEKSTGVPVWFNLTRPKPEDTTYSTPFLTVLNGQAAMVFGAGDGYIYAMQPRTGKIIWKYHCSNRGVNTPPLVADGIVYCGHREKNAANNRELGAIFAIDANKAAGEILEADLKWKIPLHSVEGSQPVLVGNRLYVVEDGGTLDVINAETGEIIEEKKVGRRPGALIYADGKLFCSEQSGNFWIFEPTEKGVKEIRRVRMKNGEELLAAPIIYKGRIYVASSQKLYCIGSEKPNTESAPTPQEKQETLGSGDVAQIQVVPVEMILKPGDSIDLSVRAFNAEGQSVEAPKVTYTVEGPAAVTAEGKLTVAESAGHEAIRVTATAGSVQSVVRARTIPPLPWKFDFAAKQVPVTWIGANYRHQPKEVDGESVLVKISTIPKGTRSQSWMGWTNLSDYTIQGDFCSTANASNGKRADMGMINQRYTLDLMEKGQLQIRSWTPRLEARFAKTIPFEWEANQWYTIKFQSANQDGQAVLRGKVWKRGEPEPAAWTIEAADAVPNTHGSPGLFGNASDAEFYIDNVSVTENQ